VLLLSATDGAQTPAGTDDRGLYIRIAPPDSIRSVITADELTVDGYLKICVLEAVTPANQQLLLLLTAELEKRGATVAKLVTYDPNATDFTAQANEVFQAGAEATVILGGVSDTARMIKALHLKARGPSDAPTYGTDLNVRPALAAAIRSD
jgi:ABC-type branched-subunit amino acid transport system substrate-binding protein